MRWPHSDQLVTLLQAIAFAWPVPSLALVLHTPKPTPPIDEDEDDDDHRGGGSVGGNIDPDDDEGLSEDEDDEGDDEGETLWTRSDAPCRPDRAGVSLRSFLCYNHQLAAICEYFHGCPPQSVTGNSPGNRIIGL